MKKTWKNLSKFSKSAIIASLGLFGHQITHTKFDEPNQKLQTSQPQQEQLIENPPTSQRIERKNPQNENLNKSITSGNHPSPFNLEKKEKYNLESLTKENLEKKALEIIEIWKQNENKPILEKLTIQQEKLLREYKKKVISNKSQKEINSTWYYKSTCDILAAIDFERNRDFFLEEIIDIIENSWKKNDNKSPLEKLTPMEEGKLKKFFNQRIKDKSESEIENTWYYKSTKDILQNLENQREHLKQQKIYQDLITKIQTLINTFSEKELEKFTQKVKNLVPKHNYYYDNKRKKWIIDLDKINPELARLTLILSSGSNVSNYVPVKVDPYQMLLKELIESNIDNNKINIVNDKEVKSALQVTKEIKDKFYPGKEDVAYYFYSGFNYTRYIADEFNFRNSTKLTPLERGIDCVIYNAGETNARKYKDSILNIREYDETPDYIRKCITIEKLFIFKLTLRTGSVVYITPNGIEEQK